jgi:hypothetical protein
MTSPIATLGNIFNPKPKSATDTTTQSPPVTPDQPGNPPSMPGTVIDNVPVPADTLQIGNQHFTSVRALAPGITPEEAAKLTANNGYDEIYFTDETGKHFMAFATKNHFDDVRAGYLGRFNGKRVKVVSVEDEDNTFKEGTIGVFTWTKNIMQNTFGNEASKSLSGIVSTAVGSFVAAAALKNGAQTAAPLIREGFMASIKGAMRGAVSGFVNTLASVILFAGAAVGVFSLINGVRAANRQANFTTIDMVTGNY